MGYRLWNFKENERYRWETYIKRIGEIPTLSPDEKQSFIEGWTMLGDVLGDEWLKSSDDEYPQNRHPLLHEILNIFKPTSESIGRFSRIGENLIALAQIEGSASVIKRFKKKNDYYSALTEFNVASLLLESGIKFRFIETDSKKTPDIEILLKNGNIRVEISILDYSDDEKISKDNWMRLNLKLMESKGILYAGRLKEPAHNINIEKLLQSIERCFSDAHTADSGVCLENDDYEFFFAGPDKSDIMSEWKLSRGMTRNTGLTGVEFDIELTKRLKRKIKSKTTQIGKKCIGILYIEVDGMIYLGKGTKPIFLFNPSILQAAIKKLKNILFVVIVSKGTILDHPIRQSNIQEFSVVNRNGTVFGNLLFMNDRVSHHYERQLTEVFLS